MIFSRTTAAVAAAAMLELYPEVGLRGAKETSFGFSYHFFFPHPLGSEMVFQLEEKMRQLVREKRAIRTLEMVPISARGLLLKEGHQARARELEGKKGLVQLAEIGPFYDLIEGPLLKNTSEVGAFKILSLEKEGKKGLRVTGVARQSKEELKEFLQRWREYPKVRHECIGEKKGLWKVCKEGILWLEEGLNVRRKWVDFWKEQLQVRWVECPPGMRLSELGGGMGEIVTQSFPYDPEKGLFEGGRQTTLQITGEPNSLLQRIRKTLMILGFSLNENFEAKFLIEDRLNRTWEAATFETLSDEMWTASIPVERNLALLIEKDYCKGTVFEN